jgi:hypothetical protein|tara:strand:- start:436 stop:750 length:315 start_codon:yes stop_codon:yes gene_type:complete
MEKFKDILETLEEASHVRRIDLFDQANNLNGSILSKPGTLGSIRVYHHLWKTFGVIDVNAAIEGIELFSEHVKAAEDHPGRHPNIDRLLQIIEDESVLTIKIIK